jgi:hypothetical protein
MLLWLDLYWAEVRPPAVLRKGFCEDQRPPVGDFGVELIDPEL